MSSAVYLVTGCNSIDSRDSKVVIQLVTVISSCKTEALLPSAGTRHIHDPCCLSVDRFQHHPKPELPVLCPPYHVNLLKRDSCWTFPRTGTGVSLPSVVYLLTGCSTMKQSCLTVFWRGKKDPKTHKRLKGTLFNQTKQDRMRISEEGFQGYAQYKKQSKHLSFAGWTLAKGKGHETDFRKIRSDGKR